MTFMNLTEWSTIPEERQHQLIIEWKRSGRWEIYERLALKAAGLLKRDLAAIPEVTNVILGGGEWLVTDGANSVIEKVLVVYTVLRESKMIERLPSRYEGFRLRQVNLGDKREA